MTLNHSYRPGFAPLIAAAALLSLGGGANAAFARTADGIIAQDQSRDDQGDARREMRAGNQLSLRQIEQRILPQMRGSEYLGPSYDSTARAYRLKFIRDGRVTYIDVDARSGRIISRSN
ncbi:hypothetical protein [Qipengyuania sp. ASV99]|uniref:hypothetical protein n=1 Tax=Qipengyuania sp. ASV99 TaxID=3399681 RepID=UPI003A4C81B0